MIDPFSPGPFPQYPKDIGIGLFLINIASIETFVITHIS